MCMKVLLVYRRKAAYFKHSVVCINSDCVHVHVKWSLLFTF